MRNKLVLFVLLIINLGVSYAQIYKWVDSQGVTHFSDTPHEGAEVVKMPDAQSYTAPISKPQQVEEAKEDEKKHTYNYIAIKQPLSEATIRNTKGYIAVVVELEPELMDGDQLQLLFDGSPLGDPQTNTLFQLKGIYRGSHTIAVQILSVSGEVLLTSDRISVYMQQPRVGMGRKS